MKKVTDEVKNKIFQLRAAGNSYGRIAKELKLSTGAITYHLKKSKTNGKTKNVVSNNESIVYLKAKNQVLQDLLSELINGKFGNV